MRRGIITGIISIIILAAAWEGYDFYQSHRPEAPLTLYGNIDIRTVDLSFRVGGRLQSLHVDEGDHIQTGQLLAQLDPQPYQIALDQANAQEHAALANLDLLQAGYRQEEIAQSKEQVKQLQSAYQYAQRSFQRYTTLRKQQAISQDELDSARDRRDQAQADLLAAEQQLSQYQRGNRPQQIEQAQAQYQEAQAGTAQAQLNLQDTQLTAPGDGTILVRAHEVGAMLNSGTTVFTLALDHPLWIKAYVDESHLGQVQPGQIISFTTDSHPNHTYHGHVGFISATAEFTPKTVQTEELRTSLVYRIRIIVDDGDALLRQGMPVTVHLSDHQNAHE
ncbi:secretion protein HlyD [Celerinatantimonas sp. YJH-8]|uniref:secretion protein HlyD n=1 Tax=Celerinatantimonas sp. YJH-8 TaxID=3228714 RepID=UPI0038C97F3B